MSSSSVPPSGPEGPEFLESDREPLPPQRGGGGRRTVLAAGALAVGLALVGGGVWAAMAFFATGSQPAEALPSSTVGYASVDLDPSGEQKIEAFRMIQKFPALEKELDGLDADDDLVARLFEDIEEECDGVSYADDVEPWLGARFGIGAVDLGEEQPTPVGVLAVSDTAAAEDGLAQLKECAGADVGGWAVDGDWAIVAETEDLADQVVAATTEGSLADDETFRRWNEEIGGSGVLSLYAAPDAGRLLADSLGMFPLGALGSLEEGAPFGDPVDPMGSATDDPAATPTVPDELAESLEEFGGMAATVRFDDGALEFEAAGAGGPQQLAFVDGGAAADAVASLPEDTAAAFGLSLSDGWFQAALEQAAELSGEAMTTEEMLAELEAETGLTEQDVEAVVGESAAVAMGSDFDPETLFGSSDGSDVPVGARIVGDSAQVSAALDKLAGQAGADAGVLAHDAEGDVVAVGPNEEYRRALLDDGSLGDSQVFRNVVREADRAGSILYVNFDAGGWLDNLAEGDAAAQENLAPLQGLGFSSWVEDDAAHVVFRLTTE